MQFAEKQPVVTSGAGIWHALYSCFCKSPNYGVSSCKLSTEGPHFPLLLGLGKFPSLQKIHFSKSTQLMPNSLFLHYMAKNHISEVCVSGNQSMKTYEICGFFLVLLKIANSTLEKTNVTLQIQTVKCEQPNVKLIAQFLSTVKKTRFENWFDDSFKI